MSITERVKNILEASHAARNSDMELHIIYMQKSGMNLTQGQIATFRSIAPQWTIRRIRQKLQQQGQFSADQAVNEFRYKQFKKVRSEIAYETPETVHQLLLGVED